MSNIDLENSVYQDFHANVGFNAHINYDELAVVSFTVPVSSNIQNVEVENNQKDYPFSIENVAVGQNADILNITIIGSDSFYEAITLTGDTDGDFKVYINGERHYRFITNANNPNEVLNVGYRIEFSPGDIFVINVQNNGEQISEYSATILGFLNYSS